MQKSNFEDLMERYQSNEITEYAIYKKLAKITKSEKNSKILDEIAEDELRHYTQWKNLTGKDIAANRLKIWFYVTMAKLFGLTFTLKLMEKGEDSAQTNYSQFIAKIEDIESIANDEGKHEQMLLELLDEERLRYVGSIVLGLNDALVELSGSLAGLTLALGNSRVIALTGAIIGIAAALSMAASEFLSTKAEESEKHPFKSSVYTGIAYIFTVGALILPYLIFKNPLISLASMLVIGILIIAFFNYYLSVALDKPFQRLFFEMVFVSLGVAGISFVIGYFVRTFLGVEV